MAENFYVFDDNYRAENKGIPLVSFYAEFKNISLPCNCTHMHFHGDFEILYITNGRMRTLINEIEIIANPGDILLINPYETHYGELLTPDLSYYCIDFNPALIPVSLKDSKYINHIKNNSLGKYIENINSAYENTPAAWDMSAIGNLLLLFYNLETYRTLPVSDNDNSFTKSILSYLSENYASNISSKTAAKYFGYDQSYFCRLFKKCFSMKFSDYLNIYRIKKAKDLLRTHNVSDVTGITGFSSTSYFSVVFKSQTGMTPKEYKEKLHILKK